MDIEKLTKSQIVLLTLLVSFVTSIATGIVTVALVEQAPPEVTASVNRVIEHTIEKVVPNTQSAAAATPQTVVVHESDSLVQAVGKGSAALVRLYTSGDNPGFLGLGMVIGSGAVVSDEALFNGDDTDAVAVLSSGEKTRMFVTRRDDINGLVFLTAASSSSIIKSWSVAQLPVGSAQLGQGIVMLAGKSTTKIASGLITSFTPRAASSSALVIDTSIPEASIMHGSPLIDQNGVLVGMSTSVSRAVSDSAFISSTQIRANMK